ncbi:phage tail tube protein [Acetobacter senegalensis]|uniref:phage tail tube protein n=1 Tax=Acetobacter senegalensis TaxID=446692 RepID=UPI002650D6E9|nr:phage tail tube protein [Acetobacter senegalensis]MDN7354344.1 phage tail tube protein [Acetobacter senegalensis]
MATGATTGYAAGEQTNTSKLDYAQEVTYNTAPGGTYQRLRMTGESLAPQDSTSTPDEINDLPEVAETVLTGRSTSGSLNGVLSYGTYDDFLAGILGADWSDAVAIVATGLTTSGFSYVKSNAVDGNRPNIISNDEPSRQIVASWPNEGYVVISDTKNNLYGLYHYKKSGIQGNIILDLGILDGLSADGPADNGATVSYASIINSNLGKTYTIRKKLAGSWQVFSGNMVNQVQIQLQKGQVPTVQIDFLGSDMTVTTVDVSSAVNAATTSPLMDVVGGFLGCSVFGQSPAGCIQSATITLARDGSGQDTGMGHVGACGIQFGALKASMDIEYFFKDYTEFLAWQAGQKGQVSVSIKGSDGYGYQFSILNGRIFNPKNPISGKNATIVTTISVTGNPLPGGGTFAIARLTPTS